MEGFHYNARVILADGKNEKIGILVNQRRSLEVLAYNEANGWFEPGLITGWRKEGPASSFLQFTVAANEGSGRHHFGSSPDQLLLTEQGYLPAKMLQPGDQLTTAVKHYLSSEHQSIVYGSMLGDGNLRRVGDYNTQLRIGHGREQIAYCRWKETQFNDLIGSSGSNSKGGHGFDTIPMHELTRLITHGYDQRGKSPSQWLINQLDPLAIAIWYLDDGTVHREPQRNDRSSICCTSFPRTQRDAAAAWFHQRGIDAFSDSRGHITFNVRATKRFQAMIAPYVHPSMDYKLMSEFRGRFEPFALQPQRTFKAVAMPIISIHPKPPTKGMYRFALEVEGGASYLVDNIIAESAAAPLQLRMAVRETRAPYAAC
ncbi:MAG TPA: hypothetical protein VGE07_11080 [Herpetosiphonaceae bacterium]